MIRWKEYKVKHNFITSYDAGEQGQYGYIGNVYAYNYYKLYGEYRQNEKYHLYFVLCGHEKIGTYDDLEILKEDAEKHFNEWLEQAKLKVKE